MSRDLLWIESEALEQLFSKVQVTENVGSRDELKAPPREFVLLPTPGWEDGERPETKKVQYPTGDSLVFPVASLVTPPPDLSASTSALSHAQTAAWGTIGVEESLAPDWSQTQAPPGRSSVPSALEPQEKEPASFNSLHAVYGAPSKRNLPAMGASFAPVVAAPVQIFRDLFSADGELSIGLDVQDDIVWSLPSKEEEHERTEELPVPEVMPFFTGEKKRLEKGEQIPLPETLKVGHLQERLDAFLTWLMPSTGSYMAYVSDAQGLPLASVFAADEYVAISSLLPPQILLPMRTYFPEQYQDSVSLHQLSFQLNEEYYFQIFWMQTSLGRMSLGLVLPEALGGSQLYTLSQIFLTILKETGGNQ